MHGQQHAPGENDGLVGALHASAAQARQVRANAHGAPADERDREALTEHAVVRGRNGARPAQALHAQPVLQANHVLQHPAPWAAPVTPGPPRGTHQLCARCGRNAHNTRGRVRTRPAKGAHDCNNVRAYTRSPTLRKLRERETCGQFKEVGCAQLSTHILVPPCVKG